MVSCDFPLNHAHTRPADGLGVDPDDISKQAILRSVADSLVRHRVAWSLPTILPTQCTAQDGRVPIDAVARVDLPCASLPARLAPLVDLRGGRHAYALDHQEVDALSD